MKVKPNLRFGREVSVKPRVVVRKTTKTLPPKNQGWEKPMLRIAIKQSGGLFCAETKLGVSRRRVTPFLKEIPRIYI